MTVDRYSYLPFCPHLIVFHIRSCIKYKMVLNVNCIMAIVPDIDISPKIIYDIKKVAELPVILQLTVLAILLFLVSLKTHTLSYFSSTNTMNSIIKRFLFNLISNITSVCDIYYIWNNLYFILTLIQWV